MLPAGSWSWSFKTIPEKKVEFLCFWPCRRLKRTHTLTTWHLFVWCDRTSPTWCMLETIETLITCQKRLNNTGKENNILQHKENLPPSYTEVNPDSKSLCLGLQSYVSFDWFQLGLSVDEIPKYDWPELSIKFLRATISFVIHYTWSSSWHVWKFVKLYSSNISSNEQN